MLPHADFLVLNVSCPNTAEGKTFEDPAALAGLLDRVMALRAELGSEVPVLVKLSPPAPLDATGGFDASALDELVDLSLERGVAGFVATNTASDRAGLSTPAARLEAIGNGGLSGAPIRARALAMTRHLRRHLEGRAAIIGVGGIDTPEAAYERVCARRRPRGALHGAGLRRPRTRRRCGAGDRARASIATATGSVADAVGSLA